MAMKHRIGTAACLAALAAASASARTITVAKSGGDHATVQAGLDAAAAGDVVLVKAGVFNERVTFGKSGTSAGHIELRGEPGAILDGTGVSGSYLVGIEDRSYVKVVGLEIRNLKNSSTPVGISVSGGGSHIEIRDNLVHHIEYPTGNAHGIAVYGDAATPISDLVVDGNEIHSCRLGQSESLVLNGNVAGWIVSNNKVHDNDNIGIDFIGFEGTGPSGQDQARNGRCFGNRVWNISSGANPTYGGERSADGIYVDGGRDIVIERNVVDNCDIAFEIASEHGGRATSNITLRNNFASRSWQGNILAGGYDADRGSASTLLIVNNTTWRGRDGELILQHNCSGVTVRNNIFVAAPGNPYLENSGSNNTGVTVGNNLYFGASASSPGSWPDTRALYADPMLAGAPDDLRLKSGSPAIDKGMLMDLAGDKDIDGDRRVQGAAPDIGADEFGPGVTLVPRLRDPPAGLTARARRNALGRFAGRFAPTPFFLSTPRE